MHEQHKGHDAMHAEMIIILLVTLILAQIALVEWKKRHYRSFSVSFKHQQSTFASLFSYFHPNYNKLSASHTDRPMDSTDMLLCKEFMVAVHIFLAAILMHNACGYAKGR